MITLDKFISNLNNISKQGNNLLKDEILALFEPVVFQYVLYTRIDKGNARKSIGLRFGEMIKSNRIIKATQYDTEVSHSVYNFWKFRGDDSWNGVCNLLVSKNLLKVSIVAEDQGLYDQAILGHLPSEEHLTRLDNTPDRMPPFHINITNDIINHSNLENITNANIAYDIANDIKLRVIILVKKIEMELFK